MSAVITVTETASCWTRSFILKSWSEAGRGAVGSVGNCFLRGVPTAFIVRPARETQTPGQEAVGEETQGLCVEKVSPQSPGKSGPFSPCGRGSRVLIPFPPETAFTFSTKAIEWLAIRPCLWYAEQEKIKDRSGRDGRSERFTGHNNHPGRRCR